MGRTTGRRGLVDVSQSSLLVSLVGPSVLPSRSSKGSSGLQSSRFSGCCGFDALRAESRSSMSDRFPFPANHSFIHPDIRIEPSRLPIHPKSIQIHPVFFEQVVKREHNSSVQGSLCAGYGRGTNSPLRLICGACCGA